MDINSFTLYFFFSLQFISKWVIDASQITSIYIDFISYTVNNNIMHSQNELEYHIIILLICECK